jgi:DNA-binding response OmpR family regulator
MVNPPEKVTLILGKDREENNFIASTLRDFGFFPLKATNIKEGEEHFIQYSPDVLIVESSLNNLFYPLIKRVKYHKPNCKILLLVTSDHFISTYDNLNIYYDDFLKKPFNKYELISRIKILLSLIDRNEYLKYKDICLNVTQGIIKVGEIGICLTIKENKICQILLNSHKEVSLAKLSHSIDSTSSATRMCLNRLRKKFEENTGMKIIKSRYGVGYYIAI